MDSMDDQSSSSNDQKQTNPVSTGVLPPLVKPKADDKPEEKPSLSFPQKDVEEVLSELEKKPEKPTPLPPLPDQKPGLKLSAEEPKEEKGPLSFLEGSGPIVKADDGKKELDFKKPAEPLGFSGPVEKKDDPLPPLPAFSPKTEEKKDLEDDKPPEQPVASVAEKSQGLGGKSGGKPKGKGKKKLLSLAAIALVLLALPIGLVVVRQSQETRRSAECSPDPDKCWTINNQNDEERCSAYCDAHDDFMGPCSSKKVLNDQCEEVLCWYCQEKETPTRVPDGCDSDDLSKRTQEGCEDWCSCSGGDIHNEYEDTCQQDTDPNSPTHLCWYCKTRPEPLDDCCSCWSDCSSLPCPEGLSCQDVEGIKRCVNPACATDQDCTCDQEPTPTPTTPVDEPTPTPPSSISCSYCRLYDEDWQLIDVGSSVFSLDQKLYLATTGATSEGVGITQARFRITVNGLAGGWQITEQKKEDEFYLPYTITQSGVYEVESMVYNPTLGWH